MRILVIIVVCLGLLLSLKLAGVFDTSVVEKPVIGAAAPNFNLDCADGSTVRLSSLRSGKVIICFWHDHESDGGCPPNKQVLLVLQQVHEKNPGLPILAIRSDYTLFKPINMRTYLSDNKFTFTVPLDTSDAASKLYNISAYPVTFFLDPGGIIREIRIGQFTGADEIDHILSSY